MIKRMMLTLSALALSLALLAGCNVTVPVNASTAGGAAASAPADPAEPDGAVKSGPVPEVPAAQSTASAASGEAAAPVASPSSTVSAGIAGSADGGQYIGEEAAKAVALENAGLNEADTQWLHMHLDYDDGRAVYDVEFYAGSEEYDYEIDAVTGEVLSMDRDAEYHPAQNGAGQSAQAGQGGVIGEEEARAAALAHAGLAETDVTFVRSHLDYDDGRQVYDVEFYAGGAEYDYEIDAETGSVLSFDADAEYYAPAAGQNGNGGGAGGAITADQAKAAALAHAGVQEADAARMQVELDRDDGRTVYDVEWRIGRTEYSYEISAADGSVISYEVDAD